MSTSIRQVGLSLGLWGGFGAQSFLFPETPSYVDPIHSPANPNARVLETLCVITQFETEKIFLHLSICTWYRGTTQ